MAPRVPTIMGWAGFDGGYKRAVSFARSLKIPVDDDPIFVPPVACSYGPELLATIGTFTDCGCAADEFRSYKILSSTVTPGVVSVPTLEGSVGPWQALFGEVEYQGYADDDFSCISPVNPPLTDVLMLTITCAGDVLFVSVVVPPIGSVSARNVFFATGAIGDTLDNTLTCPGHVAIIDTITVERP